jgi:hypothetical protein
MVKDFGRIDRNIPVRFAFSSAIEVTSRGSEEQETINAFIAKKLQQWAHETNG